MTLCDVQKKLDPRLACAAQFVRADAVFADIGTDHAYLPIALLTAGKIAYAIAADIAEKPLVSARTHLDACAKTNPGLYEKTELVQTDGLSGLENHMPRVTDIAVCGMGGELIARIIGDAGFVKNPDIRLILQPMTMQPHLRRWLAENGFQTEYERICRTANRKLYTVLCCHYTGEIALCGDADAYFGTAVIRDPENKALLPAYLAEKTKRLETIIRGKREAGLDCSSETACLAAVGHLL